jgi:hypothetical protein
MIWRSITLFGFVFGFVTIFASVTGCRALRPPVQNSGPAVSAEGVQLAVTGQDCTQVQEPDQHDNDLVEAVLEVQMRNGMSEPLLVRRDAFRLLAPDGTALRALTWRAADPLTITGGETRQFRLRFMTRGGLECAREMRLDAGSAVLLGDRPVHIQAIRFVPSRAL